MTAFTSAAERALDSREVDVVFESHADANLAANPSRLACGGRIVVIGEENPITLDVGLSMAAKQADADLRFMSIVASVDDQVPILERICERLAHGSFEVAIDAVFGPDEVAKALDELTSSGTVGKVVLDTTR